MLAIVLAGLLAAMPSAFATQGNITLNCTCRCSRRGGIRSEILSQSQELSLMRRCHKHIVDPSCNEVLNME